MTIYLQRLASIQPRTSPPKFGPACLPPSPHSINYVWNLSPSQSWRGEAAKSSQRLPPSRSSDSSGQSGRLSHSHTSGIQVRFASLHWKEDAGQAGGSGQGPPSLAYHSSAVMSCFCWFGFCSPEQCDIPSHTFARGTQRSAL